MAGLLVAAGCVSGAPGPVAGPPAHLPRAAGWSTDWARATISLDELRSGGPPRDGIPPIDRPRHVRAADVALPAGDPIISVEVGGEIRAYALRILVWHEIVNDTIGGVPVVITFCPLAHAAVVFDRRLDGRTFTFGVSGLLRRSDLVMWDRETEGLWQQFTGEGIVGAYAGRRLDILPARILPWAEFVAAHPDALVLSAETGHDRPYGQNPYDGYARLDRPPMYDGPEDGRVPPLARVVGIAVDGVARAYPLADAARLGRIDDEVAGRRIVVRYHWGTIAALDDASFDRSRAEGSASIEAPDGTPIPHLDTFWFAWAAFYPNTDVWRRP